MKNIADSLDAIMEKLAEIEAKLWQTSKPKLLVPNVKMWKHYCLSERGHLYTEEGAECNWCGRTHDETTEFGKLGEEIEL